MIGEGPISNVLITGGALTSRLSMWDNAPIVFGKTDTHY